MHGAVSDEYLVQDIYDTLKHAVRHRTVVVDASRRCVLRRVQAVRTIFTASWHRLILGLNSNTPYLMLPLWQRQMPRSHDASADAEAIAFDPCRTRILLYELPVPDMTGRAPLEDWKLENRWNGQTGKRFLCVFQAISFRGNGGMKFEV